jgi:nucleotide-binding universal stress UspA family protein
MTTRAQDELVDTGPDPVSGDDHRPRIVVGVDGGASSQEAVTWAGAEATRRRVGIDLFRALRPTGRLTAHAGLFSHDVLQEAERSARESLTRSRRRLHRIDPSVQVRSWVVRGRAVDVLTEASEVALLVVVGARRDELRGREIGPFFDSTSLQVAARAACPVVVVPGPEPPGASGVVVGWDGTVAGDAVLDFAAGAAASRRGGLFVAQVVPPGSAGGGPGTSGAGSRERHPCGAEPELSSSSVRRIAGEHPGLALDRRVVGADSVPEGLLREAQGRELLVLGTRGRGALASLLLGSTSRNALRRSTIPTLIVHPDGPRRRAEGS